MRYFSPITGLPAIAWIAWVVLTATWLPRVQADQLAEIRATAIRKAVARVSDSVVRVERLGVAQSGGEIADDAPTVAVAIDSPRHFLATSLITQNEATTILLVTADGRRSTAKILAKDQARQIVLLESAEDLDIPPIEFSDVDPSVGQTVIAVGRYEGDAVAVSSGVLSAKERVWGLALQTDARVSAVFYGGPLIDLRGRVLGLMVPLIPDDAGEDATGWYDSGIAFAIPSGEIVARLDRLRAGQNIRPGLLGIVAKQNDPYVESTQIAAVRPRSPAAQAGLLAGDEVRSIDGHRVLSHREIKQLLGAKDAGDSVAIEVAREGESISSELTLVEAIPVLRPQMLGLHVEDRPMIDDAVDDTADEADGSEVVVTGVFAESPAAGRVEVGDVVLSVDGVRPDGAQSFRRRVFSADPDKPLTIELRRDNRVITESISTAAVADRPVTQLPESMRYKLASDDEKWQLAEFELPDIDNDVLLVAPEIEPGAGSSMLGLLLVLVDPGREGLRPFAQSWVSDARAMGILVAFVSPSRDDRWQPSEIDVPSRVAAALAKQYPLDPLTKVLSGQGDGIGATMAMAVALARPEAFDGLVVRPGIRPPAVRLRENDPNSPLQIFLPMADGEETPNWLAKLDQSGFAILKGSESRDDLFRWIRSLPRI